MLEGFIPKKTRKFLLQKRFTLNLHIMLNLNNLLSLLLLLYFFFYLNWNEPSILFTLRNFFVIKRLSRIYLQKA